MKDRKLFKRIVSFGLSALLVLGLAIGHLPGGIFYEWINAANADFSLEQSELALGANVIPSKLKNNNGFMGKYIYTTDASALNLNSNFKLHSWSNIDNDISMNKGNTLTRAKLMHQKNNAWEAVYEWDMTDVQTELIKNSSYVLVYEGDLFADYHYHLLNHTDKKWDVGTAWLYNGSYASNSLNNVIWKLTAENKNDESAQHVIKELESFRIYDKLAFRAEHDGCACGSSGVSNSIFYMYDNSAPYVEKTYICRNADGTGEVRGGDGFTANQKGYVVLDFSEDIRFSDNKGERLILNLDAYYRKNNTSVDDAIIYAELISLENDKLIFQFTVPEKTGTELTDVYITGISNQQSFVGKSGGYPLELYYGDGSVAINTSSGYTVENQITDIAGNSMNWVGSAKSTGNIYLDNVKPVMTDIFISGNMVNSNSQISKDSWPEDIDRSSVFAGIGDYISFNVCFSETVTGYNADNVKAVLNIRDGNNNPIEVGVYRSYGDELIFNKLTITEDMQMPNYGTPIKIVGFKGLENLKDSYGNEMADDLTSITKAPKQGIYLDVNAPENSAGITLGENETIYIPYADEEGEYFTFPVKIKESTSVTGLANTSTIKGKQASFSLVMEGDAKSFGWYVDTNQSINKNEKWNTASTASTVESATKCAFDLIGDNEKTYYIHIKLDENTDYNYTEKLASFVDGIFFEGSIFVYAEDYAGNKESASYEMKHQVDTQKPTADIPEDASLSINYTEATAKFTTDITLNDNYGIKEAYYYWTHISKNADGTEVRTVGEEVPIVIPDGRIKELKQTVSYEFDFDADSSDGRAGSATLTVVLKDYNNRIDEVTNENPFTYDFTLSKANIKVTTGSVLNPLYFPEVFIAAPDSTATDGDAGTARTIMLIKYGEVISEDGTVYNTYFGWDPQENNTVNYLNTDLFADLKGKDSSTNGDWFLLTGIIDAEGGKFTEDNTYLFDYDDAISYFETYNGTLEIIFVTSPNFGTGTAVYWGSSYEFSMTESTLETATVYLANDEKYLAEMTSVTKDGENVESKLAYDGTKRPAKDIDNVAFEIKLSNITEKSTGNSNVADMPGYGLDLLDITKSKVELVYCDDSKYISDEVIYTWKLERLDKQTFVIPEGIAKETGWYGVKVTLYNNEGHEFVFKMDKFFFMDVYEADVMIHSYYKEYDHPFTGELIPKDMQNLAGSTSLELALDTAPEGWEVDTYLTFGRTTRTDARTYGITQDVKIRVYNKADANYASNAVWVDVSDLGDTSRVYYTPMAVTEFNDSSYGTEGALVLPLLAGDNLVCYEILNTNGVVVSHEIAMYAHTEAVTLELDVDYTKISSRTGEIMEVKVSPVVTPDLDLANAVFNYIEEGYGRYDDISYTFDNDIDNEFYLLDQNGNLSTARCKVEDVDGVKPGVGVTKEDVQSYTCFSVNVYFSDEEGAISSEEVWLTFDPYYSAILMGLPVEERANNTETITIAVPFNLEQDEEGNYIPWENYSDDYYGIYRTQVREYGPDETDAGNLSFQIWGTWRCDPADANMPERSLTFSSMDANGNENTAVAIWNYYSNSAPTVNTGVYEEGGYEDGMNIDRKLDDNGYVGIYFDRPLLDVNGYGAGTLQEGNTLGQRQLVHYTTAPMIVEDGSYIFTVTDLFGDTYETILNLDAFGDLGIDVSFSETVETRNDVVVTAEAILTGDSIASITGITDDGTLITGKVDASLPTMATITMPENGKVTITTTLGKERVVTISNIDREIEPVSVIFVNSYGEELTTTETTLYEKVTAMVICDEILVGTNGQMNYTFQLGSVRGDSYTFEYTDIAGNTGSITAVLPYDLIKTSSEEEKDETAPDFMLSIYGMRNEAYNYVGDFANPCDVDNGDGTVDHSDSLEISNAFRSYIAQNYKLVLDIEDESEVKILVQNAGSSAPVSYADAVAGSMVEHVSLSGNVIIVEENTTFDIYVIDEANNVTALTNICIDSIDNVAVKVDAVYEVAKNELGEAVVIATFVPEEPLEQIIALNSDVLSKWMTVDTYDNNSSAVIQENVLRYYYVLTENGSFEFSYKDVYGNVGKAVATVKGMNNSPAVVNSVIWHGTVNNVSPDKSNVVNKDVIAALKMSKAISDVKLYVYVSGEGSPSAANLGEAIGAEVPVEVSYTSNNVYITYEANVDYQIIAMFTAAENGKKGYYVLPAITCIDKTAPTITLVDAELAEDKRSKTFSFEASEGVLFSKNQTSSYVMNFEWKTSSNTATELVFTDKAGNITRYQITEAMLADIDTKQLSVMFSASADGANATAYPVQDLNVSAGGNIYVNVSKSAKAFLNDVEIAIFTAGTWNKVTLPETADLYVLKLVDTNTGETLYKTIAAQPKDNVAPVITFDMNTVLIEEDMSFDEMMTAIRTGVSIKDNVDGTISDYTVKGYPSTVKAGLYELVYEVEDSAGNKVEAVRNLYIMQKGTPIIKINGEPAVPYGTVVVQGFDVEIEVEGLESDVLTVKYKSGIKTVGQMKYGTITIENLKFTVNEEGFYTIYIRTQERIELITHIYVEE